MLEELLYTLDRMRNERLSSANLENGTKDFAPHAQEDCDMAKRIKRKVVIGGAALWISADSEQEYAENLIKLTREPSAEKHNFRLYAKNWFSIYSNPNIERATAETYQRQLVRHIYPRLGEMNLEDITTDHIQALFNEMGGTKASKDKTRMVLNMIFETALDEGILTRNPMKSRRLRMVLK